MRDGARGPSILPATIPNKPAFVACAVQRFPSLRTTFIRRDIAALWQSGVPLRLISMRSVDELDIAGEREAEAFRRETFYLPSMPLDLESILANIRALLRQPRTMIRCWGWGLLGTGIMPFKSKLRLLLQIWRGPVMARRLMEMGRCLHCHAQFAEGAATTALVASRLLGVGFSFTSHTSVNPPLLRQKLEHACFVASISEYDRQKLAHSVDSGVLEKIHVIHCGIPVEDWPAESPRPVGTPLRMLTVGALNEKKGHDILIRACALLKRQGIPFECRIVGSGDQQQALAGLIAQSGLSADVRLLGPLPQAAVRQELSRADVFVLAAKTTAEGDTDGIPVSLMEAMAASVPVVSTSVAGIPELVVHGVTGLLGPEQDEVRLAENIVLATQDGPERIARIARARKKIELEFNQAKESQKLAALLLERIESMATAPRRLGV